MFNLFKRKPEPSRLEILWDDLMNNLIDHGIITYMYCYKSNYYGWKGYITFTYKEFAYGVKFYENDKELHLSSKKDISSEKYEYNPCRVNASLKTLERFIRLLPELIEKYEYTTYKNFYTEEV